ncbi:hypothetical protein D3C72_1411640 [compost metagenome]
MTTDQLASDAIDHAGKLEAPFFPGQLTVINHLKQQIAQLTLQVIEVPALDGIGDFVSFFKGVRDDGGVGLLDVPWATELRIAQAVHEVKQVFKAVHHFSVSPQNPVGAGLPAMASPRCSRETELPASLASQLPQRIEVILTAYGYAAFR